MKEAEEKLRTCSTIESRVIRVTASGERSVKKHPLTAA